MSTSVYFFLALSESCMGLHVLIMSILTHAFTHNLSFQKILTFLVLSFTFFFFFLNFKVSQNLGSRRNLGCHVVWFLPLSFKWAGGQNLKFQKTQRNNGARFRKSGLLGPRGYCSVLVLVLTPTSTIFAWRMWNECRVPFRFSHRIS